MYSAVIIDDEEMVVKGIMANIDWDALGIQVIGTAYDGDEGLDLIYDTEPDIVISDIRMPAMTGLEMCRILHNSDIFPQIIFVSGYDDHTYAREALNLSAVDYILKPFNPKDLESILRSCADRLQKQASYVENFNYVNVQTTLSEVLAAGRSEMEEPLRQKILETYHLDPEAYAALILVHLDTDHGMAQKKEEFELVRECRRYLRSNPDILRDIKTIVIDLKRSNRAALFLSGSDPGDLQQAAQSCIQYIWERITRLLGRRVFFGVSETAENISRLNAMHLHAKKALHFCYFDDQHHIVYYDHLPDLPLTADIGMIHDRIVNLAKVKDIAACQRLISELFMYYSNQEDDVFPQLKLDCLKICDLIELNFSEAQRQVFAKEIKRAELTIMNSKNFREVYDKMIDIVNFVAEDGGTMEKRTDAAINSALRYIHENLAQPITLSEVAHHVHFSDSRFSVKFSQYVGEPFSKYLARQRIQRSTELFKENRFAKVYQIAELVGYTNARYFGTLFKKIMGITPLQYVATLEDLP